MNTPGLDHLALLQGEVDAMTTALHSHAPEQEITSCPGWRVADLTAHLTAVHRWVVGALRNEGTPTYAEAPADAQAYASAATAMLSRLRALPSDAPCWTFHPVDHTAGFWRRRQLHEVSIHRWDVDGHRLEPDLAADGIGEVVEFFLPRMQARGKAVLPSGTVLLDDGARTWTLTSGEGPQATVHGDTSELDLLLWGRRTLDDMTVTGDAAFAASVLAAPLTP